VTEHGVLPGLWPIQGDGVLARQGDLILLIHPAGGSFTDRLLEVLADAARTGTDGLHFTDQVSAEFDADATVADASSEAGPAVVAFGPAGHGTAVAVYGNGWAEITTSRGAQRLTAGEPYGRLRCVLPSPLVSVRAGVQAVASDAETDPYLRLADGVVRAVAFLYAPADVAGLAPGVSPAVPAAGAAAAVAAVEQPPPAPAEPEPEPEPEPDQLQQAAPADQAEEAEPEYYATRIEQAVPTPPIPPLPANPYAEPAPPLPPDPYAPPPGADQAGEEVPQHDPLLLGAEHPQAEDLDLAEMPAVTVEGVYCANGHFNDPEARYCAVCGLGMSQPPTIREKGNRPSLGVLVLDDGSVCQLDADYVIGREPTLDSAVAEGRARPLRLSGASGVVSRTHARVELDGWQVFITDLNSANGTQVLQPGERNPVNLEPGVRTPLAAGAQIRLGGEYGLQYDSHRQR